jgi:hypothetical protein
MDINKLSGGKHCATLFLRRNHAQLIGFQGFLLEVLRKKWVPLVNLTLSIYCQTPDG